MKRYTIDSYKTTTWSGGKTTQLVIEPKDAIYSNLDFDYRISSATVEVETSKFTPLVNYKRWLSLLEGDIKVRHNEGEYYGLAPFAVCQFDGADTTDAIGTCIDFNLMIR